MKKIIAWMSLSFNVNANLGNRDEGIEEATKITTAQSSAGS